MNATYIWNRKIFLKNVVNMDRDIQGVLRGSCKKCGDCSAYRVPTSGVLCAACRHPPGLHQNMDQPQPQQFTSAQPSGVPYYDGTGYAPYGSEYSAPVQAQLPSLPTCKRRDCSNPVHYDPTFGPFEYCSPQCRDAHLLEPEREKLLNDIAQQTKEIRQLGCGHGN